MNKKLALCLCLGVFLNGCGGSKNTSTTDISEPQVQQALITIPTLSNGNYRVVLGNERTNSVGQFFTGADGSRLLVVNDEQEQASAVYRADKDQRWQRIPKTDKDVSIQFLHTEVLALAPLNLDHLSASYTALIAGKMVSFNLSKEGGISPVKASVCQLSGNIGNQISAGIHNVKINTSNCPDLAVNLEGVVIQDVDYAPMKLRLVLNDGTKLFELWAAPDIN